MLIVGALVLLAAVGYGLGLLYQAGIAGLIVAFVIALFLSIGSYRYGDKLVLASARAKEVTPQEEPRLHNVVEGLCLAAGIPKPRVYLVPERAPNAFATGRDPEHSHAAVSRQREYLADAEGAHLTRYPPGLASALKKVAASDHAMRSANNATAHLWLDQPSRVQGERLSGLEKLFSTHPPIQDRIRILEEM